LGLDALFECEAHGGVHRRAGGASRAEGEVLSRAFLTLLAWLALAGAVAAANFPALTGRVVDDAGVLSGPTKTALETKLADLEAKSSIQLAVATVKDLGGDEIEPYANALFREWKLGTKDKNNGVLFLVAPNQHRMRVEVGYGLEGVLTDAAAKIIITNAAAPRFKQGDYDGGVTRAVDDIVTALTSDTSDWKPKAAAKPTEDDSWIPIVVFVVILVIILWLNRRSRRTGGAWIVPINTGGGWSSGGSSGWSSGGGGGGGFSGGGGSSGGGGASGDW
jgi:uncharacterized protein